MNQIVNAQSGQLSEWQMKNPMLAQRGIDESTWSALQSSIYPGASAQSILLAVDYCRARDFDIMLKPVHIVPMSVKNPHNNQYEFRDVILPGVGLYRIQAERSGTYAGADAPKFGPEITRKLGGVEVTFPEWCEYSVYKLIADRIVKYSAIEYWVENYATKGKGGEPNSIWLKRPRGQLAKCTEAQALRKAWPEIGQEPTAEEMYGKNINGEIDVTPKIEPVFIDSNWSETIKTITTMEQYQKSKSELIASFGGANAIPVDIRRAFSEKLKELNK